MNEVIKIEFSMNTNAFADCSNEEVANILQDLADRIRDAKNTCRSHWELCDCNGENVGCADIISK